MESYILKIIIQISDCIIKFTVSLLICSIGVRIYGVWN